MTTKSEANNGSLVIQANNHLYQLCVAIPTRRVGSAGNRQATDYVAQFLTELGFQAETPTFDCIDWSHQGAVMRGEGANFEVVPGPYTRGCTLEAPLVIASTLTDLEDIRPGEFILLLRGELTKEQLMPKNFPFYNPDEHKRIIRLLERINPLAIAAGTTEDRGLAGGQSPFPLIEDGDFDIPSVFMTADEATRLAQFAGSEITLKINAQRIPAKGCNVIARKGNPSKGRIVLCAHIDSKDGTPGAVDNATGVTILLVLAELLKDYAGSPEIELVAINGEDYYAASGEIQYVEMNQHRFDEIRLAINMDGVGYHEGLTAVSTYDCPSEIEQIVRRMISDHSGLVEGPQWFQSDHSVFIMNQTPALAFTSENVDGVWSLTHTERDTLEIVDPRILVQVARTLEKLLSSLKKASGK